MSGGKLSVEGCDNPAQEERVLRTRAKHSQSDYKKFERSHKFKSIPILCPFAACFFNRFIQSLSK